MHPMIRWTAFAVLLGLAGCLSYTDATEPARPAPVVVQPAPGSGTVVVQPQP